MLARRGRDERDESLRASIKEKESHGSMKQNGSERNKMEYNDR